MWWKLYFFILLICSTVTVIFGYGQYSTWLLADWIDVATMIVAIMGLYGYVYKKSFFVPDFWRWFFIVDVALTSFFVLYLFSVLKDMIPLPPFLQSRNIVTGQELLLSIFLSLPLYYALFQLGKSQKKVKKAKK